MVQVLSVALPCFKQQTWCTQIRIAVYKEESSGPLLWEQPRNLTRKAVSEQLTSLFVPSPTTTMGFPSENIKSNGKESTCNAGDLGSIPGSGRSPGEGNGNPLQYSCLENSMDTEAWQATVCGVAKSWT